MRRNRFTRINRSAPSQGKRLAIFKATAPDATTLTKGGFFFEPIPDRALMYIYRHGETWSASTVREDRAWGATGDGRWIDAERVKP